MERIEIPAPFKGLVAGALDALADYTIRYENGEPMTLSEKSTLFGQLMMLVGQFGADILNREEGEKNEEE